MPTAYNPQGADTSWLTPADPVQWLAMSDRIKQGYADRAYNNNLSKGDRKVTTVDKNGKTVTQTVPAGQLDETKYIQDITSLGLGPEYINRLRQERSANNESIRQQLLLDQMRGALGVDDKPAPRNNANTGEPQPVTARSRFENFFFSKKKEKEDQPLVVRTTPADDQTPMQSPEFTSMLPHTTQAPATTQTEQDRRARDVAADPNTGSTGRVEVDGAIPTTAESFTLPEDKSEFIENTYVPQDNRSIFQYEQDRYSPENGLAAKLSTQGQQSAPDESLFAWEPKNTDTNEYRDFENALKAKLNSAGYADASSYLRSVYNQTLKANTPPMPAESLLAMGLEGQAKYEEQLNAYLAGTAKARGLAEAAVNNERSKLESAAKEYGTSTIESRKTDMPDGKLRDVSKREQAAALRTNFGVLDYASAAVDNAGLDMSKLAMASTQVIAGYATATNPGQPLPEGKRMELVESLFPERAKDDVWKLKAVAALYRYAMTGDKRELSIINDQMMSMSPADLQARLKKLVVEAKALNSDNYKNYVVGGADPGSAAQKPEQKPAATGARADVAKRVADQKAKKAAATSTSKRKIVTSTAMWGVQDPKGEK